MLDKLQKTLKQHIPAWDSAKYLLAVSGGVDSVVLAYLFKQAGLAFAIAHANFGLRGEDSNLDEELVRKLAADLGAQFHSKKFDLNKSEVESNSTQMKARELRYEWFQDLANTHNLSFIATAHHLNDSFETAVLNLSKGTGISGVRGIQVIRDNIVRPLLRADKEEILAFAMEHNLSWREDRSNNSNDYQRNLIRNEVIPQLEKINPNLITTWIDSAARLSQTEEMLLQLVQQSRSKYFREGKGHAMISMAILNEIGGGLVLHELLKEYGFNWKQSVDIIKTVGSSGKIFLTEDYRLNVDRDHIIISKREDSEIAEGKMAEGDTNFSNELLTLRCQVLSTLEGQAMTQSVAFLDMDKLSFPLTVRKWQAGDSFYPLGMEHKKKLSDFMIDLKIPVNLKETVQVITSKEEIVWVVGYRVDNRFKATKESNRIFSIKQVSE